MGSYRSSLQLYSSATIQSMDFRAVMMVLLPALILGADDTLDCGPGEVSCPGVADCVPEDECSNDAIADGDERDGHNTCRWLPWIDNDDPSGTADTEWYDKRKFRCRNLQRYQVSLAKGRRRPVWNTLSDVPHNRLTWDARNQGIVCLNKHQRGCRVNSKGVALGGSCCKDYRIRFYCC